MQHTPAKSGRAPEQMVSAGSALRPQHDPPQWTWQHSWSTALQRSTHFSRRPPHPRLESKNPTISLVPTDAALHANITPQQPL